ncbi:BTB/POZ domain-containing protein [Ditylenchus destructor]|nr:BTB/POZ domain-containing protein [Ditylenchus destructor]
MTPVSTKLEWRIENFDKAMQFYKRDQSFSSKTFSLPLPMTVIWRLDVYPHGIESYRSDNPSFHLRLIGFQTTNEEKILQQALSEFKLGEPVQQFFVTDTVGSYIGSYMTAEEAIKFIHPDGSLLVICEVECLAPEKTFSMEPTSNLQLTEHIEKMWKSQLFTDCTIKVGEKSFPAHKCILGQWSEVFRKMFTPPTKEAESGDVEITDFSPEAIGAMLEYMYTGLVKDEVMDNLASDLLALSDKYAVIPLKEMCEAFIASKLTTKNFLQVVILADLYSAAKLKKACVDRLPIDGRAALQSKEWEDFKNGNKDLASELLELMIKDNPGFVDVQAKPQKTRNETMACSRKNKIIRKLAFWR